MDEIYRILKHSQFFQQLHDEQLTALAGRAQLRRFKPGAPLFTPSSPADHIFTVVTGRIRLYHVTPTGKQILLGIADSGELFGETALLVPGERAHFAEPMVASTILVISITDVKPQIVSDARLCLQAAVLVVQRRIDCERRLMSLLFRPVRERLVALLLDLSDKYGQSSPEGVRISLPLSQQDLASAIGTTRESVSLSLSELHLAGHLQVHRRQITITNTTALRAIVEQLQGPAEG